MSVSEERLASDQPGYFEILERISTNPPRRYFWLHAMCPCGCGDEFTIRLVGPDDTEHEGNWAWDGNWSMPTLQPSIRRLVGCKFHGYLTQGVWSSAGDGAPLSPRVYRGSPSHQPSGSTTMPEAGNTPAAPAVEDQAQISNKSAAEAAAQPKPVQTVITALEAPLGYAKTHVLGFIEGILHQRHDAPHPGQQPAEVYVPVPGAFTLPSPQQVSDFVKSEVSKFGEALEAREKALEAKATASTEKAPAPSAGETGQAPS